MRTSIFITTGIEYKTFKYNNYDKETLINMELQLEKINYTNLTFFI